jgi:N-acetyl-1-D-myo-inositol-2-amino-2-deoxy-alpha-D-glucopyranoside deacetylase
MEARRVLAEAGRARPTPDPPGIGGLLLVHAHPDDEAFATAGLIARAVAEGYRVDLVTCTGGEEGEIHDPTLDHAEAQPRLAEIREAELRCSLAALRGGLSGVLELHLLGYRDSGMMGTPSNDRPDAFWHADLDEAVGRVVEIVRRVRPAVMVTYDPNGNYGHPDHINAHRVAVGAWEAAADASRYPAAGPPHEVAKFYEIAFNRDRWFALMGAMKERGIALPWDFDAADDAAAAPDPSNAEAVRQVGERLEAGDEREAFGVAEADITTTVDVAAYAAQKRACMDCHKTQRQDMGWLLDLPDDLAAQAISPEFFILTRWRDRSVPPGLRETWPWDGL